jgi:hypothetical protein
MIRRIASAIVAAAVAQAVAPPAHARSYLRDNYGSGNWPSELVERPLTLAEDLTQFDIPVNFNLTDGSLWKPVTMPVRLSYGVTSDVTFAVTHQTGFCLSGPANGCAKVYNDVGAETLISIFPFGAFQAALAFGAELLSISEPFVATAVVGFNARLGVGPIALRLDPRLRIGLNERDTIGNREFLSVPVTLQLQATSNVALVAGLAMSGPLDPAAGSFSSSYIVPMNVGLAYTTGDFDLGASFILVDLRGNVLPGATGARAGQFFGSLRF